MGRPKKKSGKRNGPDRRPSIWDAVMVATAAGWSATMRLCVLLVVICTALIVTALLNARALGALMAMLGG